MSSRSREKAKRRKLLDIEVPAQTQVIGRIGKTAPSGMSDAMGAALEKAKSCRLLLHTHCEEFTEPQCLVDWVNWERLPALAKIDPVYRSNLAGAEDFKEVPCYATFFGVRVRLVMASRFGDVGITERLTDNVGYQVRIYCDLLTDFSATP